MRTRMIMAALLLPAALQAQLSGYASTGVSAHGNPLYNYEMIADRLTEGYLELTYEHETDEGSWSLGYVGGLMLFDKLAARNYYEHRAILKSTGPSLSVSAEIGARHDRDIFKEFDNLGCSITGAYAWGEEGASRVSISDQLGYRSYTYIRELSNVTNVAQLAVTAGDRREVSTRYFVSFGVKRFTKDVIDSSAFASVQATGNSGNGKGKGSGSSSGNGSGSNSGSSKKQSVLVASSSATSYQITAGISLGKEWTGGSVEGGFLYRLDPGSTTRLLAQVANSSILGEDIYNDHFSYAGPELFCTFQQGLPLGFRLNVSVEAQLRNFLAPAFDLAGVETNPDRVDRRGAIQASVARSFSLSDAVTMDVTLSGSGMRNQSNDTYNDFSVRAIGVSLGVGF